MASIELKNVAKSYDGKNWVIPGIDLEIKDGEFVVLVGPSGCGKSTTLRLIAGLEEVTDGDLLMDGKRVNDISPKERNISMVFQNYALYPHYTVYKNMSFALKLAKLSKDEIDRRIQNAAEILGLSELLERKPKALSGGQRQRVALGRALVRNPSVFLLDEPLSNLDAKLRTQMRSEISKLHKRLGTTFVYVTHDQVEAMTMGERICVMDKGKIMQFDQPQVLYDRPANLFVAGFIGTPQMNLIPCELIEEDGQFSLVVGEKDHFPIPAEKLEGLDMNAWMGKKLVLGLRPEAVSIEAKGSAAQSFTATVDLVELLGADAQVLSTYRDQQIIARAPAHNQIDLEQEITLYADMSKAHLFDEESGQAIFH